MKKPLRKIYHLCGGMLFPLGYFLMARVGPISDPRVLALWISASLALIFLLTDLIRLGFPALNDWALHTFSFMYKDKERRTLTGSTNMMLAAFVVVLLFPRSLVVLSLTFIAVGDVSATTVGEHGTFRFFSKSLEGFFAFFLAAFVAGLLLRYLGLDTTALRVIVGALAAALVEFLPIPLDDNFTVPFLSCCAMSLV